MKGVETLIDFMKVIAAFTFFRSSLFLLLFVFLECMLFSICLVSGMSPRVVDTKEARGREEEE